jgi:hypothetical protein
LPDARKDEFGAYGDTFLFLQHEGFVSDESRVVDRTCYPVSLTLRGLSVLNASPAGLAPKQTLGQQLTAAVTDGSRGLVKLVVESVFKQALGG